MRTHGQMIIPMAIGLASIALLAIAPASAGEDVRTAIEAANDEWEAGVSRGDAPGVAALYTATGQILPAHSDIVTGREAIAGFLQAAFDSGVKGATLSTVEVEGFGDTAHEVGKFQFLDAGGSVLDHGKYLVIWKKENGAWKLHRDMFSTSVAAAEP